MSRFTPLCKLISAANSGSAAGVEKSLAGDEELLDLDEFNKCISVGAYADFTGDVGGVTILEDVGDIESCMLGDLVFPGFLTTGVLPVLPEFLTTATLPVGEPTY